jgi:hypothetical protein
MENYLENSSQIPEGLRQKHKKSRRRFGEMQKRKKSDEIKGNPEAKEAANYEWQTAMDSWWQGAPSRKDYEQKSEYKAAKQTWKSGMPQFSPFAARAREAFPPQNSR